MSGGGRDQPSLAIWETSVMGSRALSKEMCCHFIVSSKCYIDKRYQLEFLPALTVPASGARHSQ